MTQQHGASRRVARHISNLQAAVAILSGLITIVAATYSFFKFVSPAPDTGQVLAVIQEAESGKAVPNARFEILTPRKALVATLKADANGRVRYALKEGTYDVRVCHENYGPVTNEIQVTPGHSVELTVELNPPSSPIKGIGRAVKKIIRQ